MGSVAFSPHGQPPPCGEESSPSLLVHHPQLPERDSDPLRAGRLNDHHTTATNSGVAVACFRTRGSDSDHGGGV